MNEENPNPTEQPEDNQGDKPPPSNGKRKRIAIGVLAVVAIVGAAVGIPYYLHSLKYESTDDAYIEGDVIPLSSRVPGYIRSIPVKNNQWVEKSQLLVELDPTAFEVRLEQAQANVAIAEASIKTSESQLESAKNLLAQAKADVNVAEAARDHTVAEEHVADTELTLAKADLKRIQQLPESTAVSKQSVDHAQAAVTTKEAELASAKQESLQAEAQVKRMQAAVGVAEGTVDERASQVEEAKRRLDAAKAAMKAAQLDLDHTKVYAPVAGKINSRAAELGAWVQPGQVLVAVVPAEVWVVANLKETQLANVHPGQTVEISVDAYPGREFRGHVDSIQPGTGSRFSLLPAQNATGNFVKVVQRVPVKILLDDGGDMKSLNLVPGMSVEPEISIKGK